MFTLYRTHTPRETTLLWIGEPKNVTLAEDDSATGFQRRLFTDHFTVDVAQGRVVRRQRHHA